MNDTNWDDCGDGHPSYAHMLPSDREIAVMADEALRREFGAGWRGVQAAARERYPGVPPGARGPAI